MDYQDHPEKPARNIKDTHFYGPSKNLLWALVIFT